jgi:hypothetical protein
MTQVEEKAVAAVVEILTNLGEEALRTVVKKCAARAETLGNGGSNKCNTLARRLFRCADRGAV